MQHKVILKFQQQSCSLLCSYHKVRKISKNSRMKVLRIYYVLDTKHVLGRYVKRMHFEPLFYMELSRSFSNDEAHQLVNLAMFQLEHNLWD